MCNKKCAAAKGFWLEIVNCDWVHMVVHWLSIPMFIGDNIDSECGGSLWYGYVAKVYSYNYLSIQMLYRTLGLSLEIVTKRTEERSDAAPCMP